MRVQFSIVVFCCDFIHENQPTTVLFSSVFFFMIFADRKVDMHLSLAETHSKRISLWNWTRKISKNLLLKFLSLKKKKEEEEERRWSDMDFLHWVVVAMPLAAIRMPAISVVMARRLWHAAMQRNCVQIVDNIFLSMWPITIYTFNIIRQKFAHVEALDRIVDLCAYFARVRHEHETFQMNHEYFGNFFYGETFCEHVFRFAFGAQWLLGAVYDFFVHKRPQTVFESYRRALLFVCLFV